MTEVILMKPHRRRDGMALAIILAFIVLVTVAVVAFFSYATSNRRVESSRANRAKADLLSQSATTYMTGEFLNELKAGSSPDTQNGVTIYNPSTPQNSVPQRKIATTLSGTDRNFFNLIRQSVAGADTNISTHNTADAARNGRAFSPARWNSPRLVAGSGFTQADQIPNWIYIDQKLGVTGTTGPDVIGRFAYNVYDVGGLLNANAIGFPSQLSDTEKLRIKGKATGADLTRLSGSITPASVDELLSFRHPDSPTSSEYVGRTVGADSNGWLTVQNKNADSHASFIQNMFASRQDLIRYVDTKNTAFKDALPYLTHFSRSINAPSWRPPATPVNANPNLLAVRFSASGTVPHFNDAGEPGSYEVQAGDPILQRRFSLAKLAWLTPTGPAPNISTDAIKSVFGLLWNSGEERWDYVGPTGTTVLDSIKTLSEVAAEASPREPNLMELLKSGILTGSLGGTALGKTSTDSAKQKMSLLGQPALLVDANKELHILKIAANIIDCSDSDNYPTRLALKFGPETLERAGVENLPYIYCVDTAILREVEIISDPKPYKIKSCHFVWVPELFCPHVSVPSSSGPSSITIGMEGFLDKVTISSGGSLDNKVPGDAPNKDLSALPTIDVPSSTWENFRAAPGPIRDATSATRLELLTPDATSIDKDLVAFHLYSYPIDLSVTSTTGYPSTLPFKMSSGDARAVAALHDVFTTLSFKTPNNHTKIYATTGGYRELPSTGINGLEREDTFVGPVLTHSGQLSSQQTIDRIDSPAMILSDARSSRFGPMFLRYRRLAGEAPTFTRTPEKSMPFPYFFWPLVPFSNTAPNYRDFPGNLPQLPGFQDPDLTLRSPDAGIGFAGNGTTPTQANPYGALADMTRRPVVLQRPYRNVAELGYAFRDVPWQTLNFYNAQTADSALLDLFSVIDESSVTAGRVNIASRQPPVLEALLSQTAQAYTGTSPLSATETSTIAAAMGTLAYTAGAPTANIPINPADIATFVPIAASSTPTLSSKKFYRESIARALAGGQSRTWNLMFDVVTQTGRFPKGQSNAENFLVEGENHSWISIAIDRFTGRIVDLQVEKVYE